MFKIRKDISVEEPEMHFKSDEEFADFCVAPYAIVKDGTWVGVYSEMYLDAIKMGTHFIIEDTESEIYKHKALTKRVPLRMEDRLTSRDTVLIKLKVENLENYSLHLFKERARQKHLEKKPSEKG